MNEDVIDIDSVTFENNDSYNEANSFNEPVVDNSFEQTPAQISRSENEAELRELARQNERYNKNNEREFANTQDSINNDISENNDISNTQIQDNTKRSNEKKSQSLESQMVNENSKEQVAQEMAKERENKNVQKSPETLAMQKRFENLNKEIEQDKQMHFQNIANHPTADIVEPQTNTQIKAKQQDSESKENENNQNANLESNNKDSKKEKKQIDNMLYVEHDQNLDFFNRKPYQRDALWEQNQQGEIGLNKFANDFPAIKKVFDLNDEINSLKKENQELENPQEQKRNHFDKEKFDKNQRRIDEAEQELDKALDNLTKVRSFADLIRAIYMLNEARFEMKEANKIMQNDPQIREIMEAHQQGKILTKENLIKGLTYLKANSYDKLRDAVIERQKEHNMAKNIDNEIEKYKGSISQAQKSIHIQNIQNSLNECEKTLPKFNKPNRYQRLVEKSNHYIKEHNKELSKNKTQETNINQSRSR
ncbi:hypothetical protein [Helicobacter saguini]|uniref:Uncharacterized protein n=1 Tax=Helicobacter saguini TaxID=1548018 RepID=A0A6L7DIC2_9HELI|nr:hypothetical protein [Helicobacter saguini]MWV60994.1 hypothetical protein [Helicobacter saguini]MWV70198.1 hypothetical protein [Helicobacter saguini]MWV72101.1 hypothetical protein [Helicobacter saguini]